MMSLRTRLFLILVTTTGLIWLFAIGWIYVGTRHEVEGVLDARLQEAARMVASLAPIAICVWVRKPASGVRSSCAAKAVISRSCNRALSTFSNS
jgi:hypothetical protein